METQNDEIAAKALARLAEAAERMAKNGFDLVTMAGAVKAPLMSDRDERRSHVWLSAYCAAVNCEGITHTNATRCADGALEQFEKRFLKGN